MAEDQADRLFAWIGFGSAAEYGAQMRRAPRLLAAHALRPSHEYKLLGSGSSHLKRTLNGFHVAFLGLGMMLGGTVFITAGYAAANLAGPAVTVSFALAGLAALLAALCYAEFAVRLPRAGAAHAYVLSAFGELPAWIVAATTILQFVLANAAVARSLAPYAAELSNYPRGWATMQTADGRTVDGLSAGLLAGVSLLAMFSSASASWFNIVITGASVLATVGMVVAGFTRSDPANLTSDFAPFGAAGMADGAAYVFAAFVGFQLIPALAEEVVQPRRDLVWGLTSSVSIVTVLYVAMAAMLACMVPYQSIDVVTPFPSAFAYGNYMWGQYIVSLAAILGIISSALVGTMGVSRVLGGVARQHMLPPFMGRVDTTLQTPIAATLVVLVVTIPIAVLCDTSSLVTLAAAGNLVNFVTVALALVWVRLCKPGAGAKANAAPAALATMLLATTIAFGSCYRAGAAAATVGLITAGCLHVVVALALALLAWRAAPPSFAVPLFPLVPAASLLADAVLLSSIPGSAFAQYGIFLGAATGVYLLYGLPARGALQARGAAAAAAGGGGGGRGAEGVAR